MESEKSRKSRTSRSFRAGAPVRSAAAAGIGTGYPDRDCTGVTSDGEVVEGAGIGTQDLQDCQKAALASSLEGYARSGWV